MEEENGLKPTCCSGCLVCLAFAWGSVRLVICCQCRALSRLLVYPSEDDEDGDEDITESSLTDPETPTPPPRETRVRFRSSPVIIYYVAAESRRSCISSGCIDFY